MSVLDQWQDRWEFAAYNHEQRFQTALVTKRRLFNAILNYPLTQIQNRLLRPDLHFDPKTGEKLKKGIEFDAAAWRFIDDVVIGAGGGQFVRSYLFAYGNNRDFRAVHNASRALEGFGMAAEVYDTSPLSLSDEIKAGRDSAIYGLVNHSAEASDLLDQFVHGRLDISPSNVAKLQKHLESMAKLCEERAELKKWRDALRDPENLRKEREVVGEGQERASGYIRDVMHLEKIETPRQAQILSGFVSALMVDAAKPLGTEMYIPQDDIFMPAEDAVKLSEFIAKQMEHRGFVANVSLNGTKPRPFPDLPEGVMIRALRDEKTGEVVDHGRLTEAESLSFANALHGFVKNELGSKVENLLRYVDKNFDEIENSLARSKENPIPEPIPIWKKGEPHTKPPVEERIRQVWEKGRSLNPFRMLQDVTLVAKTAVRHVTRPEAMYENNKLFGRAISGQLVSYPVKVLDEMLKSFLRYSGGEYKFNPETGQADIKERRGGLDKHGNYVPLKGLDALIDATRTGELKGELFDRKGFINNLKSSTFRLVTSPIAASIGTVLLQEAYHLPKGLAVEASERAGTVLKGAIKAGHRHAPQVAGRLAAMRGEHPSVRALVESERYKTALPAIAAKKPEERTEEDYSLLASYYQELSDICLSVAEEALSPYGVDVKPEKISTMDEVVTRVLRDPVKNMPDAMIALAYVQTFVSISKTKTSSVEYVKPEELLIGHKELKALGNFIDGQARTAGLVPAKGGEAEGVEKGDLLERDKDTGKLRPACEETLIRFANVVTEELKKHVEIDSLLYAVKGKYKDDYLDRIEDSLFGPTHFELGDAKKEQDAPGEESDKAEKGAAEELVKPWRSKVKRDVSGNLSNIKQNIAHPEVQHEIKKLLGRSKGEAVSAFMPGLIYNSLQHDEPIFSRAGMYSAVFKTATYPLLYSYGLVAGKEAINETVLKRRHTINESNVSQSIIEGALIASGNADPELRRNLIEANKINADLLYVQTRNEFKDIPRIAAKPRELRTENDTQLMAGFCEAIGEKLIDNSARIFAALGQGKGGEAIEDVVERALQQPVTTLNDAVITLGFLHTMLEKNARNLDVLTFVKPEDRILDRKQLRAMAEFMNDQAANAGFALHGVPVSGKNGASFTIMGQGDDTLKEGELLQWNDGNQRYERAPAEAVIRYANVATEKFRALAQDRAKGEGAGKLAEKYKVETKESIFRHVRSPNAKEDGKAGDSDGKGEQGRAWVSDKKFAPRQEIDKELEGLLKANGIREDERDSHRARVLTGAANTPAAPTPSR